MDAEVTESAPPAKPDRTLLAILVIVGLLVVTALVVVVVRGTVRDSLDPSTPEGVVQRYAQAVIDGDDAAAGDYLAGPVDDCEYYGRESTDLRLTLQSTKITGSTARVLVSVSTSNGGGPFSNYEYSYDDEFRLTKSGETWLIEYTPYEFGTCDFTGGNS
jgi:hypothetical protein